MHLLLSSIAVFAGFLAGGFLTALLLELIRDGPRWLVIPTMVVALVVLCVGGLRAGEWLVRRFAARCPECRGPAYAEGHRPIRFRCVACGHIHYSRMRTNWGDN
jgi:hypothetical protein